MRGAPEPAEDSADRADRKPRSGGICADRSLTHRVMEGCVEQCHRPPLTGIRHRAAVPYAPAPPVGHRIVNRGLTHTELADRSRTNLQFISKLERGVTSPTLGMLLRLAEALDCRLYDLVEVFDQGARILPKSRKD